MDQNRWPRGLWGWLIDFICRFFLEIIAFLLMAGLLVWLFLK